MSDVLRNMIRFAVFILVQVYVLNQVPYLHRFITPSLYFLFILWLPFAVSRQWLLILGFITGITLDYFTMTPGLHAAACLLVAYVRPFLVGLLMPKEVTEFNYREPSPKAMLWSPYFIYILVLTVLHHSYLLLLEWLDAGSFTDMLIRLLSSTGISLLLIIVVELLFPRKLKFRTNTA